MASGRIDGAITGVGFAGGSKEDVNEGWFDVSFSGNPAEDVLSLVNIKGSDFIGKSGEGLKFFFEGLV